MKNVKVKMKKRGNASANHLSYFCFYIFPFAFLISPSSAFLPHVLFKYRRVIIGYAQ